MRFLDDLVPSIGNNSSPGGRTVFRSLHWLVVLILFFGRSVPVPAGDSPSPLWVLKPVLRPPVPSGFSRSSNPVDAFVAAEYKSRGLTPVGPADKRTLLRRVYLDLIGLPPTPAEQDAFLKDASPDAYEKVVDRLLASEQHGVRYAPALAGRAAIRGCR